MLPSADQEGAVALVPQFDFGHQRQELEESYTSQHPGYLKDRSGSSTMLNKTQPFLVGRRAILCLPGARLSDKLLRVRKPSLTQLNPYGASPTPAQMRGFGADKPREARCGQWFIRVTALQTCLFLCCFIFPVDFSNVISVLPHDSP